MNGQDLYNARIIATPDCVWWDGITLKEYKKANVRKSSSSTYTKIYNKIAAADYHAIKAALTSH